MSGAGIACCRICGGSLTIKSDYIAGSLAERDEECRHCGLYQYAYSYGTTWERWGRDGDGDGDVDPQNLYDATAAAAAYLCAGRGLATEEGLRAGYFSYNHSEAYVENVLRNAYAYRQLQIPSQSR